MIDRQLEVDVAEVPHTIEQPQPAGGALLALLARAHRIVQHSEGDGRALGVLVVQVLPHNLQGGGGACA